MSDKQKILQQRFNILKDHARRLGWTSASREIYKTIHRELNEECNRTYNENWTKLIKETENIYNEPKKFWKNIGRMMGAKEDRAPYLKTSNGDKVYKDNEKAKLLRDTWENVFRISEEENAEFDINNEQEVLRYLKANELRTIPYVTSDLTRLSEDNPLIKPVETHTIKNIIQKTKDKAPGESGIRNSILEQIPPIATQKLKNIFDHSLSMGYFPDQIKNAILCFTPKPEKDNKDPNNYRPISLLEVPGKILERILNDRLIRYLETNNKLNNNQYGFRKGRGTQLALAKMYEIIAISQRERQRCNIVSRDVQKAFDKVWHEGLKFKILQQDLPLIFEKILCNFLTGRSAKVRVNNSLSEKIDLLSGVPQGSIISPSLYILYTADTPQPGPGTVDISFADDNAQIVIYPGRGREELAERTAREIERINTYENMWKIKTNINKFQLLSVSSTKPKAVIANGNNIPFKNKIKILGLTLTTRGLSNHISQRKSQADHQLLKLKRFKKLDPKIKYRLYTTMIRPILEYPAIPTCVTSKAGIKKLQTTQNKALRNCWPGNAWEERVTNVQTHERFEIDTMNIRLYNLASRTWSKLEALNNELIEHSNELNNTIGNDHNWWPRLSPYIARGEPAPAY